ncbi:MAG: glucose-6-phosphate dehydrogenase assembly protein OpcA [Gammaproteobacteria bacterium]|nr:glucose-6-phosphate dehydrogenase assembly protein OpcA [Gammaproteobacteria bacterium]
MNENSDAGVDDSENETLLSYPPRKVRISHIQGELDGLWDDYQQDLNDGQAVTRACMSNLIIFCDNDELSAEIETDIPDIVQTHPARVLLLSSAAQTSEPGIEVFISSHYCKLGSGLQVCGEQIRVVADTQASRRLPSIALAQLVGDLPTTLWWASRQPPPLAGKLFYKLAAMADQIIYDSIGWINPTKGLQAMSRWVAAERNEYVVFNLAWRRLKPWRHLLSQVLDPTIQPGALDRVSHITIEHGPNALPMALLMLGWCAFLLDWKATEGKASLGKETVLHFNHSGRQIPVTIKRQDMGKPTLHKLYWHWQNKKMYSAVFARLGDERLGIVGDDSDVPVRVISAPEHCRSVLVSAQMAHRSRDKMFEQALEVGNSMVSVLSASDPSKNA